MPLLQRPQAFGFEGIVYWDSVLFPVDHSLPTPKYEPTAQEITDWFLAASKSDDLRTVNITSQAEVMDITPRPIALRGWRHSKRLPLHLTLQIILDHAVTSAELVHALISAWESNSEIALSALDIDAGVGERGVIGNFHVSLNKAEPLRSLQEWTAICEPHSYIDWYES